VETRVEYPADEAETAVVKPAEFDRIIRETPDDAVGAEVIAVHGPVEIGNISEAIYDFPPPPPPPVPESLPPPPLSPLPPPSPPNPSPPAPDPIRVRLVLEGGSGDGGGATEGAPLVINSPELVFKAYFYLPGGAQPAAVDGVSAEDLRLFVRSPPTADPIVRDQHFEVALEMSQFGVYDSTFRVAAINQWPDCDIQSRTLEVFLMEKSVRPVDSTYTGNSKSNSVYVQWFPGPDHIIECPGYEIMMDVVVSISPTGNASCVGVATELEKAFVTVLRQEIGLEGPLVSVTCPPVLARELSEYTLKVTISLETSPTVLIDAAKLYDLMISEDIGQKLKDAMNSAVIESISVIVITGQITTPPTPELTSDPTSAQPSPPPPPAPSPPSATPTPTPTPAPSTQAPTAAPGPTAPTPAPTDVGQTPAPGTSPSAPTPAPTPASPTPAPAPAPTVAQAPTALLGDAGDGGGDSGGDGDGDNQAAIIGGAVAAGVVAIILVAVAVYVVRRRQQQATAPAPSGGGNDQPLLPQGEATEATS